MKHHLIVLGSFLLLPRLGSRWTLASQPFSFAFKEARRPRVRIVVRSGRTQGLLCSSWCTISPAGVRVAQGKNQPTPISRKLTLCCVN